MSVLDLQGMQPTERPKGPPPGSHGSKGCNNTGNGGDTTNNSNVSLLCDIL